MLKAVFILLFILALSCRIDEIVIFFCNNIGGVHGVNWELISLGILDQQGISGITVQVIPVFVPKIGRGIFFPVSHRPSGS